MALGHYAYFALYSTRLTVDELNERAGLVADETLTVGATKPVHAWRIISESVDLSAVEQVDALVRRLAPSLGSLGELAAELWREEEIVPVRLCVNNIRLPGSKPFLLSEEDLSSGARQLLEVSGASLRVYDVDDAVDERSP